MVGTGYLLTLQGYFGTYVAKSDLRMPAQLEELLIEIELEDGSRDSLLRALHYRQEYCKREQADLDQIITTVESGARGLGPVVGYILNPYRMEEVGPSEVSRCLARTHSETSFLKLPTACSCSMNAPCQKAPAPFKLCRHISHCSKASP